VRGVSVEDDLSGRESGVDSTKEKREETIIEGATLESRKDLGKRQRKSYIIKEKKRKKQIWVKEKVVCGTEQTVSGSGKRA
jgi:hypothetical protein